MIEDCEQAIKLHPANIKAYFRAARACNGLHKYARAAELCEEGLLRDPANAELAKERAAAHEGLRRREDDSKKKQAQVACPPAPARPCGCGGGSGLAASRTESAAPGRTV